MANIDDAQKMLSAVADISTLIVTLAQKNTELVTMYNKAISEQRLPTKEEHEAVRKGFMDQLNAAQETYERLIKKDA